MLTSGLHVHMCAFLHRNMYIDMAWFLNNTWEYIGKGGDGKPIILLTISNNLNKKTKRNKCFPEGKFKAF